MASNFNLAEATAQPSQRTISSESVNVVRLPSQTRERDLLYSISRAMKYAEFLSLGARDVDSPLVQKSSPLPNVLKEIPSEGVLLSEYTEINRIRGEENTLSFQDYKLLRSPNNANITYRNVIRGMGLIEESGSFTSDLIGPQDAEII